MAWCPICKNEYRDGFKYCSECKVKLVDSLEPLQEEKVPLCNFDSEEVAKKFVKFLNYSKFKNYLDITDDGYFIKCDKDDFRAGQAKVKGFVNVEKSLKIQRNIDSSYYIFENPEAVSDDCKGIISNEDTENSDNDGDLANSEILADSADSEKYSAVNAHEALIEQAKQLDQSHTYQSKRFKADETLNSGIMFLVFGAFGLAFIGLNFIGVLHLLVLGFSSIVMSLIFLGMIIGGFISIKSAKRMTSEANEEDAFTEQLKSWAKDNLTYERVHSADEAGASEEFNVLYRINYIKDVLSKQFEGLDEAFLDYFSEEFYYENFESEGKDD
jgi:hypothetical protein